MDKKQRSAIGRFRRVTEFLNTNQVDGTAVKLQALAQVVRDMTGTGEERDVSDRMTRGATVQQRALREALWKQHLAPIARIARRVISDPEVRVKFRLPQKRADNRVVLDAARGIAQLAEAHANAFTQQGLPPEFVAQLRSAIDDLERVLDTRLASMRRRKTSREALQKLVRRGVAAVDVLDAIVQPRLAGQPDLLAAWNSVRRPVDLGGAVSGGSIEADITPVIKVA
jgi:hypothetical protein